MASKPVVRCSLLVNPEGLPEDEDMQTRLAFGTVAHRLIQRFYGSWRNEVRGVFEWCGGPCDVSYHADLFDGETVFEIKSSRYLSEYRGLAVLQASAYYHFLNARFAKFIRYSLAYEVDEDNNSIKLKVDWVFEPFEPLPLDEVLNVFRVNFEVLKRRGVVEASD